MTPQEKELILNVFDRLSKSGVGQKDNEAEALIREQTQRFPDAPYGLVQAVVVQEMGLNQATARINELQRQLDEARAAGHGQSSGGFLSGAGPWGGGSVPRSGPQPAPVQPSGPAYASPPQSSPWSQPSPVGGFLRNAATMAAGVAGGTLIAEGLSSLFGGHHFGFGSPFGGYAGGFGGGGGPWGGSPGAENVTVNNYYGDQGGGGDDSAQDTGQDSASDQDDGYQDASYDDGDSGFDGGFDGSTDV